MPLYEDWKARQLPRQVKTAAIHFQDALLKQAAVDAKHLTGLPSWDKYQTYLQAKLEYAQGEVAGWAQKARTALTDDERVLVQIHLNVFDSQIELLTDCLALPKTIIEEHARSTTSAHD